MRMDEKTRRLRDSFLAVFCSDHGRIVLEHLGTFALDDQYDFCPDARKADFIAGRRSVVTYIRAILKGDNNNG